MEIQQMRHKKTNDIIADHGDYLEIDISTPKFPDATMLVDVDVWDTHDGGRVFSMVIRKTQKYICAQYNRNHRGFYFHRDVIDCREVDHINHGTLSFIDNRRSNLRSVTSSQNGMNKSVYSSSKIGIAGVNWDKDHGMWRVKINISGKSTHLGYFDNIEIAIGVRQQAEREYYGEFAYGGSK
jgi:hypothetical protein